MEKGFIVIQAKYIRISFPKDNDKPGIIRKCHPLQELGK